MKYIIMSTKNRLKEYVQFLGLGQNAFEKKVGIANGYLASKSQTVNSDAIEKVLALYPNINLNWLFTGIGEMEQTEANGDETMVRALLETIKDQQKKIDRLLERLEEVEEELKKERSA